MLQRSESADTIDFGSIRATDAMAILCKLKGHLADRGAARHDGEDHWSVCKRCGATLIRAHDGWREPNADEVAAHVGHRERRTGLESEAGLGDGRLS